MQHSLLVNATRECHASTVGHKQWKVYSWSVTATLGKCLQVWPEGLAGMELKVNGFSHKLPLLLEQLVKALVTLKVRPFILCAILIFSLARSTVLIQYHSGKIPHNLGGNLAHLKDSQ